MIKEVVIVGALGTPTGCSQGTLARHSVVESDSVMVRALLERTGTNVHAAGEVILGQVLTADAGQNPVCQSAINDRLFDTVPAITINDVCGSGLKALHLATQVIQCGEADIVTMSGRGNMSRAPYVFTDSRTGAQLGSSQPVDSLVYDGLQDAFDDCHMGITMENLAQEYGIGHELQNARTLHSQHKTQTATDAERFRDEIVPVVILRNGQLFVVDTDEQPRTDASAEGLARLDPTSDRLGSVTAGNVLSTNDGAATVMMMSEAKAQGLNLSVPVRIRASTSVGVDPALMGIVPVHVTRRCLEYVGWQLVDVDLTEANEAFAARALFVGKMLGWDERRVNVNGGIIAPGHPIDAPDCRVLVLLVHEMAKRRTHKGLVTLRIGDDQGVALTIERD